MKKFLVYNWVFMCVFFLNCQDNPLEVNGKGKLTGSVVEDANFTPVTNAKITVSSINTTSFSDAEGDFVFEEIAVGDYSISVEKEGFITTYEPATVLLNDVTNVVFELLIETALNKAPLSPTLLSPENQKKDLELEVDFIWQSSDPEEDEILYKIIVSNDKNNDIIKIENLNDTIYTLGNLSFSTKYFWQVSASDGINTEVMSAVFSFATKAVPLNHLLYVKSENLLSAIYSSSINNSLEIEGEFKVSGANENAWKPRKNPVNNTIAYLSFVNNQAHIFTMNTDGSNKKQVTKEKAILGFDYNELDFSWSPDGGSIIYPNYDKLYKINSNGSELELLYTTGNGNFISKCSWNAASDKIVLKTNDLNGYQVEIYTIDTSGIIIDIVLTGVSGAAGGLDFSVQGDKILYSYDITGFENSSYRQLDSHVFLYDIPSLTTIDLSSLKNDGTNDIDPRFSANEAGIIFVNTSNNNGSELNIYYNKINEVERTLIISNAMMPDWE